jgi:hypothetical protein
VIEVLSLNSEFIRRYFICYFCFQKLRLEIKELRKGTVTTAYGKLGKAPHVKLSTPHPKVLLNDESSNVDSECDSLVLAL